MSGFKTLLAMTIPGLAMNKARGQATGIFEGRDFENGPPVLLVVVGDSLHNPGKPFQIFAI